MSSETTPDRPCLRCGKPRPLSRRTTCSWECTFQLYFIEKPARQKAQELARRAADPIWQAKIARRQRRKADYEERKRLKEIRRKYSHLKFDLFPKELARQSKPAKSDIGTWKGDIEALIG